MAPSNNEDHEGTAISDQNNNYTYTLRFKKRKGLIWNLVYSWQYCENICLFSSTQTHSSKIVLLFIVFLFIRQLGREKLFTPGWVPKPILNRTKPIIYYYTETHYCPTNNTGFPRKHRVFQTNTNPAPKPKIRPNHFVTAHLLNDNWGKRNYTEFGTGSMWIHIVYTVILHTEYNMHRYA